MVIRLSALYIYPVKSMKGVNLSTMQITSWGPHSDRRFMLIDDSHRFITQRKYPQLALIETELTDKHLILKVPAQKPLTLAISSSGKQTQATVWKDTCAALDQDPVINEVLSRFLNTSVRLVYMPESTFRNVDPAFAISSKNRVSFADGYPFLITTESSLEDLNKRLGQSFLMNRFRPNLVLSGSKPYEEDHWKAIRIGTILFHLVKPCSRCTTTCVDQDTAKTSNDPLQTLATYRKTAKGIIFGQNAIHDTTGSISIGSLVEIIT